MSTVRIPTPLRPYADGLKEVETSAGTVRTVLLDLAARYPALRPHLFNGDGKVRPYINVFVNDQDIRSLRGEDTPLAPSDRVMIVPSIAGGGLQPVDHAALRANQAVIIGTLAGSYIAGASALPVLVGVLMLVGAGRARPAFGWVYAWLRRAGVLRPDVLPDNPEPHRFAQFLGGIFLLGAGAAFALDLPFVGWFLVGLVALLAGINLFAGVCVGCVLYYWLARVHLPGFTKVPPPGAQAGRRPTD
jgi:molybdopterin converting factor small subunit